MLRKYEKNAFNKIIKYDKSLIIWPRQTGKSFIIYKSIENFVINNKDKKIFFITDSIRNFNNAISRIYKDIGTVVLNNSSSTIRFINNNNLKFLSINNKFSSYLTYNPDYIIIDSYIGIRKNIDNILDLNMYINSSNSKKCKCLFTFLYDIDIIKIIDYKNDFYINILPYEYINHYEKKMNISKDLSYKSFDLLDYFDLIYIRKQKIQKLNNL